MWSQLVNTVLGIMLMVFPWLLQMEKPVADNLHIVGPLVAMFALTAVFESTRNVRWLNIPLGFWLMVSPLFISHNTTLSIVSTVVTGALVIVFSLIKGKMKHRFGGGWRTLIQRS